MKTLTKRENRAKLVADARAIVNTADSEKRSMTAEENAQFERMMADVDKLGQEIDSEEKETELRSKLEAAERSVTETRGRKTEATQPGSEQPETDAEFRNRFAHLSPRDRAAIEHRSTKEYRRKYANWLTNGAEYRDLQAGSDTQGGYLVAPIQFVDELIVNKKNLVFLREISTLHTVTDSQGLGAPSLDVDVSAPVWTNEIATGNDDTTMRFGKRELYPHPLAKLVKISNRLLRVNTVPAEGTVRDRLAYQFSVTEENAFLNGDGNQQPLGVFFASPMGISTGRDVSSEATAALSADGLIDAKYTLKQQYLNSKNLRWVMHRSAVAAVRKLKTGDGQYIWQPGLSQGRPDLLLDVPVCMSEYAPSTFTTGDYIAVLGDFAYYWIADALTVEIQRLNELYAQTNQTGFIGREEVDGMPVLEEAFVRVKLG